MYLLLSKSAIKAAGFQSDLQNDIAKIWGGSFLRVAIVLATIVYLEIQKSPTKTCKFAENANAYDSAIKIHTQFADPSTAVEKSVV